MDRFDLTEMPRRHYRHRVWDSGRWQGFEGRPDDILVCTPYKSGTTWMQMICALLVFQTPRLPLPLAEISYWMELHGAPAEEIHRRFAAQTHRRIIKTHTPLDGLPWQRRARHICVLRDPRDVIVSVMHHLKNSNPQADALFMQDMQEARELPEDPNDFLRMWLTEGSFDWESDGAPYWSFFRHGYSFWQHRDQANIKMVHYNDLKSDLEGQMRDIAAYLEIAVPDRIWPDLVQAATFESMKANADRTAPDTNFNMWKDNAAFFRSGTSGQWRDVLDERSLALLQEVLAAYPEEYARWLMRDR